MNFRPIYWVWIIFLVQPDYAFCQAEIDPVISQVLNAIPEDLPEELDIQELTDQLAYYRKHPIDLNKTDGSELKEMPFISSLQVFSILKYRSENGDFIDALELQSIDGLELPLIRLLLPFIIIGKKFITLEPISRHLFAQTGQELFIRYGQVLEPQEGYLKDVAGYDGSPAKISLRYRLTVGPHLGFSLLMEKDPGERLTFKTALPHFDLSSGNIALSGEGTLKKLVVGNYSLEFGQGLCMWSGLSLGKGGPVSATPRQGIGLKPSASASSVMALKGIAGNLVTHKLSITPFVSLLRKDATLEVSDSGLAEVSSVNVSGFHRTTDEIAKRNDLQEQIYGLGTRYTSQKLTVGAVGMLTHFNYPFQQTDSGYQQFDFSGNQLVNLSLFYNYNHQNVYFFGETAHSLNSGFAWLNGVIASLSPRVNVVMLYRDYQRDYHSFFNQAIAEGSGVNEQGYYTGLNISFLSAFQLDCYADSFRFPWLKYRVDAPSRGHELSVQLTYSYRKKANVTIKYRYKIKGENDELEANIHTVEDVGKQNCRVEIAAKVSHSIELRNRVEFCNYQKGLQPAENGWLMYQDVIYAPLSSRISGNLRFGVFQVSSFNTRIYTYENDVLYSYANPFFQGSGSRSYVNVRFKINKQADLWLRYARTGYVHQETIGSGADRINGPIKSDVKIQLRLRL